MMVSSCFSTFSPPERLEPDPAIPGQTADRPGVSTGSTGKLSLLDTQHSKTPGDFTKIIISS